MGGLVGLYSIIQNNEFSFFVEVLELDSASCCVYLLTLRKDGMTRLGGYPHWEK